MRRRLTLLVVATTGLMLVVFVIPLGLIMQRFVAERATDAALNNAQTLVVLVGTGDRTALQAAVNQLNAAGSDQVTVFLPGGTRIGAPAAPSVAVQLAERGRSVTVATPAGREIALAVVQPSGGTAAVRVLVGNNALTQDVSRLWSVLGLLALALFVLAVLVADWLARRLAGPLAEAAGASRLLAAGALDTRAAVSGPAEVRAVATALNHLAGRIQDLVHQAREDVADLSHRLRTPLAALRMEVDADAADAEDPGRAQRIAARVEAVENAVTELIRDARRRGREHGPQVCDAAAVLREQVDYWSPLAEDEGRAMTVDLAPGPLMVRVGAEDLRAGSDALLGNVFAHTPPGTAFSVTLEAREAGARLRIADHGPGFTDPDAARRGESGARSTGLGLDIARRTALATGGTFQVDGSPRGVVAVLDLGAP